MGGGAIWTVGHSTHPAGELLGLLAEQHIATLADVRAFPSSRHFPQYNRDQLASTLAAAGIDYVWLGDTLGGRRRSRGDGDSPNDAWRNASFRAYADHMAGPEFARGLAELERIATVGPTAIMCAEALWTRCHRMLISDALQARGWSVIHITGHGTEPHRSIVPHLVGPDGVLTYPRNVDRPPQLGEAPVS